jgi:hypothetical protein
MKESVMDTLREEDITVIPNPVEAEFVNSDGQKPTLFETWIWGDFDDNFLRVVVRQKFINNKGIAGNLRFTVPLCDDYVFLDFQTRLQGKLKTYDDYKLEEIDPDLPVSIDVAPLGLGETIVITYAYSLFTKFDKNGKIIIHMSGSESGPDDYERAVAMNFKKPRDGLYFCFRNLPQGSHIEIKDPFLRLYPDGNKVHVIPNYEKAVGDRTADLIEENRQRLMEGEINLDDISKMAMETVIPIFNRDVLILLGDVLNDDSFRSGDYEERFGSAVKGKFFQTAESYREKENYRFLINFFPISEVESAIKAKITSFFRDEASASSVLKKALDIDDNSFIELFGLLEEMARENAKFSGASQNAIPVNFETIFKTSLDHIPVNVKGYIIVTERFLEPAEVVDIVHIWAVAINRYIKQIYGWEERYPHLERLTREFSSDLGQKLQDKIFRDVYKFVDIKIS